MNYIKIFQNAQAFSVSVGNTYSEDQLMYIFLDKFHQCGKYSAQKASHLAEFRREKKIIDQKCLSISSLQTDYLNIDSSSGCGRIARDLIFSRQSVLLLRFSPFCRRKN